MFSIGYLSNYTVTFSVFFTSYGSIYYLQKGVKKWGVTPLSSEHKLFSVESFKLICTQKPMGNSFNDAVLRSTRDNNFFCKLQDRQIIPSK